jgi:aminoglycoside 6'-N-acetyltransferase I
LAVPKTAAEIHTTLKRGFANESIVQRAGERSQGASCEMVSGMGRIMAMAVTSIRAARQEDEDELAELRTLLWPDGTVEQHRREVQKLIESGMSGTLPGVVLVAMDDDERLAGFIEVGLRSHADGCDVAQPVGFVEGWFVREGLRGQGIGKQLMNAAEGWSRAQNCHEIASDALVDNMESREAHSALGFDVVDVCVHFRKGL